MPHLAKRPGSALTTMLVALIPAIVAAFAFAPALQAGITPEDFGWLTLARHLDSPLPLLHENVFFVYFYRPTGLLFWWLSGQLFGTNAWLHNAADLCLHALNAALISLLALRLLRHPMAALVAGLLFACLPIGVGTAMWLSDRFDALALLFGLLALLGLEAVPTRNWARPVMALCLLLALTSKEVAFALAATMLLRVGWDWWTLQHRPWRSAGWILAAMIAAVSLRLATGTAADNAVNGEEVLWRLLRGIAIWWWRLPSALFGFSPISLWSGVLLVAVAGLGVATVVRGLRLHDRHHGACVVTGAGLLLLPCLLQWPIVAMALGNEAGLISLNLRFYYLAGAGLALLGGAAVAGIAQRQVQIGTTAFLLLVSVAGLWRTRAIAAEWTQRYGSASVLHQRLAADVGARQFPPACRIELEAPSLDDDFRTHADTIIKAGAPRDASVLNCAVFAGRPVYNTIVGRSLCDESAWPDLHLNHENGHSMLAPIGNLCTLQFAEPDHAAPGSNVVRLMIDGEGRVQ